MNVTNIFKGIGKFSVRFRWLIIIFWIAMVPILTQVLPTIASVSKDNNADFLPKSSQSSKAAVLANKFGSAKSTSNIVVVYSRDRANLTAADQLSIKENTTAIERLSGVVNSQDLGVSKDGQAEQIYFGISTTPTGTVATTLLKNIRSIVTKTSPAGLSANVGGAFATSQDSSSGNSSSLQNTEIYSVVLIIVLLVIVFRSVLAPLVTLLPAVLALLIASPLIAESTKIGVQVSFLTQILLIVLLLGAGTDYGLFLVFRMREEMRKGLSKNEAIVEAISRVGESITFSAATVIAALLTLLVASFGIYKGIGPALAIGLFVMLLAALTFLPALLSVLGKAVYWPSKIKKQESKVGIWGRLSDRVIKKPKAMLVLGIVIFGALSLGIIGYKTTGFSSNSTAAKTTDSAKAQVVTSAHFAGSSNNPQSIIFSFSSPVWTQTSKISEIESLLASSNQFKSINGPTNFNGYSITPAQLEELHVNPSSNPELSQAVNQFISSDGKTVKFNVVLEAGQSGTVAAANAIPQVRTVINATSSKVGAVEGQISSQDAIGYDVSHIATHDLKTIIPIVLIIIAILLAIMLRSLVAPLYLIITVVLSYFASLGFSMIVFVHLGGQPGLNFIVPFMLFIFAMALGEDYNILVMSRIREEAHKEPSLKIAVSKAIGVTGTTVTSAGLILAGTFGVLGFVGGGGQIEQIGYSVAFGILLDTFFVRTLLVPSIVVILGRWNWYPSRLYKES